LLVLGLFIFPSVSSRRVASYPVYTVDLVGGDKIGGEVRGLPAPSAAPKQETKKAEAKPPPKVQETKKEKVVEIPTKTKEKEKVAVKETKKEKEVKETKKEVQAEQGLSEKVREKLIQSAVERARDRAQQKGKEAQGMSSGSGEGEGAASLGEGGRGGGTVKGIEFISYHNRMLSLIRDRWAWAGRRSDLEVTVRFGIQENGEITGLKIVKRSGDPSFDDSVFRAVSKANPLPAPPESYRKDFMDVELTFRPKDLAGG
jgi:colicin import membrane protein